MLAWKYFYGQSSERDGPEDDYCQPIDRPRVGKKGVNKMDYVLLSTMCPGRGYVQ